MLSAAPHQVIKSLRQRPPTHVKVGFNLLSAHLSLQKCRPWHMDGTSNKAVDNAVTLEELFVAKFSEALKTVGKQLDFVDLYTKREKFRDDIIEIIGKDLNGYVLEDAAIAGRGGRSVEKLMISSATAFAETKRAILEMFPNSGLYELYGSSEAGWVTMLHPDEQFDHLGTVGREVVGSAPIRLLDDDGNEVPDGAPGELFSSSPYQFQGYWNCRTRRPRRSGAIIFPLAILRCATRQGSSG